MQGIIGLNLEKILGRFTRAEKDFKPWALKEKREMLMVSI